MRAVLRLGGDRVSFVVVFSPAQSNPALPVSSSSNSDLRTHSSFLVAKTSLLLALSLSPTPTEEILDRLDEPLAFQRWLAVLCFCENVLMPRAWSAKGVLAVFDTATAGEVAAALLAFLYTNFHAFA